MRVVASSRDEPRLRAVAEMVAPGSTVADVGSGDGRLARMLASRGCTVIATEKTRGQTRRLTTAISGTTVRVVEGFGLRPLRDLCLDVVVISGLGSRNIARILEDAPAALPWSLLLQPMQDPEALAHALRRLNRGVGRARLVRSRSRIYPVLEVPLGLGWNGGPVGRREDLLPWFSDDPLWDAWRDEVLQRGQRAGARASDPGGRRRLHGEDCGPRRDVGHASTSLASKI